MSHHFNHDLSFSHFHSLAENFQDNLTYVHPTRGMIPVEIRTQAEGQVIKVGYLNMAGRFEHLVSAHRDHHFGRRVGNAVTYVGGLRHLTFVVKSSTGDLVRCVA